jgi:hypothetical protein
MRAVHWLPGAHDIVFPCCPTDAAIAVDPTHAALLHVFAGSGKLFVENGRKLLQLQSPELALGKKAA